VDGIETRRREARRRYVLEERTVSNQCVLARTGLVERSLDELRHPERQHSADQGRHQPVIPIDDPGKPQAAEDPDRGGEDENQDVEGGQRGRDARRGQTLGPRDEPIDLGLLRAGREHAVGRQLLAPLLERGQLRHGLLPCPDLVGGRGRQQPGRERCAAVRCRRRAKPLKDRRASEQVEIERVRVMSQVGAGRRIGGGQRVPSSFDARNRPQASRPQRVVPRRALFNARVPGDQRSKDDEQQARKDERQRTTIARNAPEEAADGRQERREPPPRDDG
jgi:hypothetical protein